MALVRRLIGWFDPARRVIAAAILGWILLIVVASGDKPDSSRWVGLPDLGDILVIVVLAAAGLGLVVMLAILPMREELPERPRLTVRQRLMRAALFVALLLAIERGVFDNLRQSDRDASSPETPEVVEETPSQPIDNDPVGSNDLLGLALVALTAGALWALTRGRTQVEAEATGPDLDEADLAPIVDEALAALLYGDDPRDAVLAAYAVLERSLDAGGHPRLRSETATEHIRQVLASLPIDPSPLVQLGELYELARFSDHAIEPADRNRAAAHLDEARTELAALR